VFGTKQRRQIVARLHRRVHSSHSSGTVAGE
jgi:hypothetical protein